MSGAVVAALLAAVPPPPPAVARAPLLASVAAQARSAPRLDVPLIRQAPERCGPAAVAMVLRFYGADGRALEEIELAYDPVLRGALITELAAATRRAGYPAAVESPGEDSLASLLRERVPPVLLFERGVGRVGRGHYAVIVGWDSIRSEYTLLDGGARARVMKRDELMRRWKASGARALVVRRRAS